VLNHGDGVGHERGECRYTFNGWLNGTEQIYRDIAYRHTDVPDDNDQVAGTWDYEEGGIRKPADAAYIVAASPDVILALLDELDTLRERLAETPAPDAPQQAEPPDDGVRRAAADVISAWDAHGTAIALRGWIDILRERLAETPAPAAPQQAERERDALRGLLQGIERRVNRDLDAVWKEPKP
jgi:hypothetical protein